MTRKYVLLFLTSILVFTACQSSNESQKKEVTRLLQASEFTEAAEKHQGDFQTYQVEDELLFYLSQSYLEYYRSINWRLRQGRNEAGPFPVNVIFERTEDMLRFSEEEQSSFSKQADSGPFAPYFATLQESLWQNIFTSLYYWNQGSLDSTLVELRRNHQKVNIYRQLAQPNGRQTHKDVQLSFRSSALMQYLAMIYYREDHQLDDWRISRKNLQAITTDRSYYPQTIPEDQLPSSQIPEGFGSLNFSIFTGTGVRKYAQSIRILKVPGGVIVQLEDAGNDQDDLGFGVISIPSLSKNFSYYEMKIPAMAELENNIDRITIAIDEGKEKQLYALESFAKIHMEIFRRLRNDFLPKQIATFVIKTVASELAQEALNNVSSPAGVLASLAGSLLVNITNPPPDLRISSFSPSIAWVGEQQVPIGLRQIKIRYYSSGQLTHQKILNLHVASNRTEIIQDYYAR